MVLALGCHDCDQAVAVDLSFPEVNIALPTPLQAAAICPVIVLPPFTSLIARASIIVVILVNKTDSPSQPIAQDSVFIR